MKAPKFYYAVHFTTMQTKSYIDADGANIEITGLVECEDIPDTIAQSLMSSVGEHLVFYKKPHGDVDDTVFTLIPYKYCQVSHNEWYALVSADTLRQLLFCKSTHGLLMLLC